jgi:hypothetical protein
MTWRLRYVTTALATTAGLVLAGMTTADAAPGHRSPSPAQFPGAHYTVRQILSGTRLHHWYVPAGGTARKREPLAQPDDMTRLGGDLFTAFQNGIGPQGQPSADGNTDSTVVEFTPAGRPVTQWDIHGKCDGLTAQPSAHRVIATVNEDANSSIYTITPGAPLGDQITHYQYNVPLPSKGGTDAISIYHGQVLVSASAPGTTGKPAPQPGYPAVYRVSFHPASHVAHVSALFYDEARAVVANVDGFGHPVRLALTDPDSNEVVPVPSQRFGGDFMLTSQGDKEQIYVRAPGMPGPRLQVLRLSQSVDDTAWAGSSPGRLYAADNGADTVDMVTGPFRPGTVFEAVTPCDANGAPATCPAPGYPPNYLGVQDPWTGHITRVPASGPAMHPQGMIFVP